MIGRVVAAIVVLATFGLLGATMTLYPQRFEKSRLRWPWTWESPIWWVRILGVIFLVFSVGISIALLATA
jgi:protein-S-isoprenylcysteine O-methyltransferase Ste14